jgi:hypothetical protein
MTYFVKALARACPDRPTWLGPNYFFRLQLGRMTCRLPHFLKRKIDDASSDFLIFRPIWQVENQGLIFFIPKSIFKLFFLFYRYFHLKIMMKIFVGVFINKPWPNSFRCFFYLFINFLVMISNTTSNTFIIRVLYQHCKKLTNNELV